jgi:ubiquinone/menaquinone biosynthesis C-methylase UbiE
VVKFDTLATKYRGNIAREYESKRCDPKWLAEQSAAKEMLQRIPRGSNALDVPVGTGRLIPILAKGGLLITGVDASPDMLEEARQCARSIDASVRLMRGDIRELPFQANSFDVVTCLRFLNWIEMEGVRKVVTELSRVSCDKLIVGVRYLTPTSEMGVAGRDLLWRGAQLLGLPSRRVTRWGMVLHDKREIEKMFEMLALTAVECRLIERRWDGTDYVFYLLQKDRELPDGSQ